LYTYCIENVTHFTPSIVTDSDRVDVFAADFGYGFGMGLEFLRQHWAILVASVLATGLALFVLFRLYQDSAHGRLRILSNSLRAREDAAQAAAKAAQKAAAKLERMRARADSVKPRHAEEAAGALQDAQALAKIADDQVLVARNLLRKHIFEEYPPKRHLALRNKYLGREEAQTKPFTMGD